MKYSKKIYLCQKTIILVFIKKQIRLLLVFCSFLHWNLTPDIYAQPNKKEKQMNLAYQSYMPNIAPQASHIDSANISVQDSGRYTIQICSMLHKLKDPFFQGKHNIKIIQMGELYRYLFSSYSSLPKAQKDLIWIQQIYPDAYIRTYNNGTLGLAIN